MTQTPGQQLDSIMTDLDRTGKAWVAAGGELDTPEYEAREAVFARLKTWNAEQAERQGMPATTKPRKCQACGHTGGTLAPKRSAEFDQLARDAGRDPHADLPTRWLCDGETFAADGPPACLARQLDAPLRRRP